MPPKPDIFADNLTIINLSWGSGGFSNYEQSQINIAHDPTVPLLLLLPEMDPILHPMAKNMPHTILPVMTT